MSADEKTVTFHLATREHEVFLKLLQLYPVVPPAHQTVSKELRDPRTVESQRLLDEALAEQRVANKRQLETWLAMPQRFEKTKSGYRFGLERSDSEWFLQILNDIRVGNWLRLDSPETFELNSTSVKFEQLPAWAAMQMSGYFQMSILEALES